MEKIIKILEENRLYDDCPIYVKVNKKDDFLKNYKINNTSYNPLPSNIKRNNDGYILLSELPFIISDLDTNTRRKAFWILLDNGSRFFIKTEDDDEMENELLFKELAKILNIPCANYDIAILGDKTYTISNSFLGIDDFIFDYYELNKYQHQEYVDIDKLLDKAKEINQDLFLRKTLVIDGLVKNVDRFPKNFRTIINNGQNIICPLFDNGLRVKALVTEPYINNSSNFNTIIEYLMQDNNFKNWIYNYIINKDIPDIRQIIQNEKNIYIDDKTYDSFLTYLNEGKAIIKQAYKNS